MKRGLKLLVLAGTAVALLARAQNANTPDQGQPTVSSTGSFSGNVTSSGTISAPVFDGGVFVGTAATLSGAAVVGTVAYAPVVDAGVVIVPTTGKYCLDGPGCAVNVQWGGSGGGGTVQFGPSAGNSTASSGQTVTGTSKLRDVISNDTSGGACTNEGASVGFKDRIAVCNSSNTTMFTVSDTDGTATSGVGIANQVAIAGSTTTNPVTLTATGSDTNIKVNVVPKGTGDLRVTARAVPVLGNTATGPIMICYGEKALSSGVVTITFSSESCGEAFGGTPVCFCGNTSNTTEDACSTTAESTTQVTLNGTTTATYSWLCIGARP